MVATCHQGRQASAPFGPHHHGARAALRSSLTRSFESAQELQCVHHPIVALFWHCRWLEIRPLSSAAAESRRAMSHAYPTKPTTCTCPPTP